MSNNITISIKKELWKKLNFIKKPGQSFSDVLNKILCDDGDDKTNIFE